MNSSNTIPCTWLLMSLAPLCTSMIMSLWLLLPSSMTVIVTNRYVGHLILASLSTVLSLTLSVGLLQQTSWNSCLLLLGHRGLPGELSSSMIPGKSIRTFSSSTTTPLPSTLPMTFWSSQNYLEQLTGIQNTRTRCLSGVWVTKSQNPNILIWSTTTLDARPIFSNCL